LNQFQTLIYSKDYDICITETWLSDNIFDNEILPNGYSIYRNDRNTRGGGVMLAIKNTIPSSVISPTTFCLVYNPPNSSEEYMLSLFDYVYSVANLCNNKLILIGDLNFPMIDWNLLQGDTSLSNSFCELIFNLNLTQLVDKSTHNCGNILDLVITNIEDNISSLLIHLADFIPFKSDHFPITFSLNTQSSLLHHTICLIIQRVTM